MKDKIKELRKNIFKLRAELLTASDTRHMLFPENLTNHRKKLGMTQLELSQMIGLSRTQITNIELGNSECTLKTLIKICDLTETTPNDLLEYT